MRKRIICFLCVFCLVMACGCAAGSGTGPGNGKKSPSEKEDIKDKDKAGKKTEAEEKKNEEKPEAGSSFEDIYGPYDGYTYFDDDGNVKYFLGTDGEFTLHCMFVSGDPEPYEVVYKIEFSDEILNGNTLTAKKVIETGQGTDITSWFELISFTFGDDTVRMDVERDESTLAGGSGDNLLAGKYWMIPKSEGPQKESSDEGYTPEELCDMAQDYYNRHNGYYPPEADWTEENGLYTIHLYEVVDNGDGTTHTATSAWYEVDKYGKGTDIIMGNEVDLSN